MSQNWLQHTLRRRSWRVQRQAVALGALGLFVAIIIGALYLAQASSLSTLGRQLEDLIAERNRLEQTNQQLSAEIAELRSVPRLLARAQELGFAEATRDQMEFLVIEGYNPNRTQTAAPVEQEAEEEPLPVYDETFMGWLQQQWDMFRSQFERFSGEEE
jgi:cell division protein FtsB